MHQEFFDTLHKDHEEVDKILSQLEKATGTARQEHLMHLREEIIPHLRGEEAAFYPPLLKHGESKSGAQESIREHREAEDTLTKLTSMSSGSEEWMGTFHQLKEKIQHHVQEEEGRVFNEARKVLSEDQLNTILTEFNNENERAKQRVKTV